MFLFQLNNNYLPSDLAFYAPQSTSSTLAMSKLSNSLKALINAPAARPGTVPASQNIQSVYRKIQQDAKSNNVSQSSWLTLSVCFIALCSSRYLIF